MLMISDKNLLKLFELNYIWLIKSVEMIFRSSTRRTASTGTRESRAECWDLSIGCMVYFKYPEDCWVDDMAPKLYLALPILSVLFWVF